MAELSLLVAFTAGVVSFLAPCVLPIIPGYIAFLSGTSVKDSKAHQLEIFLNSIFFVLGFAAVFSLLGVLLNTLLEAVAFDAQIWLARIGGILIIFFGLFLMGLIKIKFLEKEHRFAPKLKFKSKYLSSFVFGAAFAAGWTPCVGAVLGAILGLAAAQPSLAFLMLLTYSIGFGIPFLLVGLFTIPASNFIAKYAKAAKVINIIFGILLIILGILIFTNQLARIANFELLNRILLS